MDRDELVVSGIVVALLVVIALAIVAYVNEGREWDAFKAAHACRVVAHVKGSSQLAPGFSGSGNMTMTVITESDKTGWLCDDGVTYYR